MSAPPSWAATQRGPAQFRPLNGPNSSVDSFDPRNLPANGSNNGSALGRVPSNRSNRYGEQQQQVPGSQQPQAQGQKRFPTTEPPGSPIGQGPVSQGPTQSSLQGPQRSSTFQLLKPSQQPPVHNNPSSPSGIDSTGPGNHRRVQSLRPFSAYQPLDQPDPYQPSHTNVNAASSPRRPPSPTGSTSESIRTAATPLTFKSPELRSALSLQESQQKKIYMEGYLSRRDALGADGKPLRAGDPRKAWHLCFVQLSGTVLSVWSVKQMEQAAKEGKEVPPTYINVTDSFVDLIGNLIEDPTEIPGSRGRYENVFALNSAGNNRILFCVEGAVGRRLVQAWINGIRLASWEKVRLEEIYTGSLIRARLGAVGAGATPDTAPMQGPPPAIKNMVIASPLAKGKMEGWVKARFMGSTEWKKCWLVLTKDRPDEAAASGGGVGRRLWQKLGSVGDRSSILSITSPTPQSQLDGGISRPASIIGHAGGQREIEPPPGCNGAKGTAQFFETKKHKKAFATMVYAAHTFAVYPSRPELVEGSSLFKVEGAFPQSQVVSATNRIRQTGWVMIMPELEVGSKGANAEMMKWVIGFMDAYKLYGRPDGFVWDARSPQSAFFAYPIGPYKDRLFLDRELAEFLDVREERHLASRANLHGIMSARMRGERTPILPPLPTPNTAHTRQLNGNGGQNVTTADSGVNGLAREESEEELRSPPAPPSPVPETKSNSLPPLDFGGSKGALPKSFDAAPLTSESVAAQVTSSNHIDGPQSSSVDSATSVQPSREPIISQAPDLDAIGEQRSREGSVNFHAALERHMQDPTQRPASGGTVSPAYVYGTALQPEEERGNAITRLYQTGSAFSPIESRSSAEQTSSIRGSLKQPSTAETSRSQGQSQSQNQSTAGAFTRRQKTASSSSDSTPSNGRQSATTAKSTSVDSAAAIPALTTLCQPQPPQSQQSQQPQQSKPMPILAPSGRGAEAEQQKSQYGQSVKSDADTFSSYDEGALFYLRSMSDQLPVPTTASSGPGFGKPPQPKIDSGRPAVVTASAATAPGRDSPKAETPSVYTQPSYLNTPLEPGRASVAQGQDDTTSIAKGNEDRLGEDALAAYSYLDQPPSPSGPTRNGEQTVAPPIVSRPIPPTSFPSSFSQNKRTQERKEAAQVQAAAHAEALTKPGKRTGGEKKGLKQPRRQAWGEESDEDEDEEPAQDDDDEQESQSKGPQISSSGLTSGVSGSAPLSPRLAASGGITTGNSSIDQERSAQVAAAADLPNPGMSGSSNMGTPYGVSGGRVSSPGPMRASTSSPSGPQQRAGGIHPALIPGQQQRQMSYQSNLSAPLEDRSPGQGSQNGPSRQTFVTLSNGDRSGPNTVPFQSHGLLQAGAADKAERSAKQQESDARQMGVAMLGPPSQPPQPQVGLLGAIAARERERKGAGGLGANLTERERQRVEAERRQREEEQVNRSYQSQSQSGALSPQMTGGQWGGMMPGMMPGMPGMPGMMPNGMMGNPFMWQQMMMMNPMMMGMGMPGGGYGGGSGSQMSHGGSHGGGAGGASPPAQIDPYLQQQQLQQQMAAAMAAQQAYMQAVAIASQSQHGYLGGGESGTGGPTRGHAPSMSTHGMQPSSPTMASMPNPFPSHISMYGMPMMGTMPGFPMGGATGAGVPSEFGGMYGQPLQQQQQQGRGSPGGYPSPSHRNRDTPGGQ